ncbi:MAG: carboxypeptidase M32 [Candidatus Korarchaeum sp.]
MLFISPEVKELLKRYRSVWSLEYALSLLGWDMETYMPPRASAERGEVRALLEAQIQGIYTHPEFIGLVESVKPQNEFEEGLIRVLRRRIKYYTKLPREFIEEEERTVTQAFQDWREARAKSDFSVFKPVLGRIVELQRRKAEYLGYEDHPYDALLDLYEEGLTLRKCERIFSVMSEISALFRRLKERYPEKHPIEDIKYDEAFLRRLIDHVLTHLGFDHSRARVDTSPHPFTVNMGLYDVRITVRYEGRDFKRALMAAVHEFGHASYEMNIDEGLRATPLQRGASLSFHESQSRFWENVVGRSRAFVTRFYDAMKLAVPELRSYSEDDIYTYLTIVRPELIRVEADEVQYPLHIGLRFELERRLLEGDVSVEELPEAWNEKMEELIGILPPNDSLGVLQDIHWAHATIGYFPTYAIGSMIASQLYYRLGLREPVEEGRYDELMAILKEKVHRHGSVYHPEELLRRATGEQLNPDHFLRYLREKYSDR